MPIKIHLVTDRQAICFIEENDIDGFRNYLEENSTLFFDEPEEFETEKEALAYCKCLAKNVDEHYPAERLPLRSFEEYDKPFIELIENY